MTDELAPRWRKRVNISRSVKGVISFEATCERIDIHVENSEMVAETKDLVEQLTAEWPQVIGE